MSKSLFLYSVDSLIQGQQHSVAAVRSLLAEETFMILESLWSRALLNSHGLIKFTLKAEQLPPVLEAFPSRASPLPLLLQAAQDAGAEVQVRLMEFATNEPELVQARLNILFELFNRGLLRGSEPESRQALLDSFTHLPNRYLNAEGRFLDYPKTGEPAAIDKFESLLATMAEVLKENGNRIVPSAMIRNGVYVGKRNIFMFHAAVNIAAYIGDDNLIDSHASLGSAVQIGNGNKIGSFVSFEGVLSPANAQGVIIGNRNFFGSFARIGTGITIGDENFIASGVNISLGTKIRDCRQDSPSLGDYITCRELNLSFNNLAICPNNAAREFNSVALLPGEYILFGNSQDFMKRFEGDDRIKK